MNTETQIKKAKYIIVGAGLSGLTCAYQLQKSGEDDFLLLESRDRAGGRILTKDGIDYGATWFQEHHKYVHQLCEELGVGKFPQYSQGQSMLIYSSMAPAHYFENDPSALPASRIAGGTSALIEALSDRLLSKIVYNTHVSGVLLNQDQLELKTSRAQYSTTKLVITVPPLIATRIMFEPGLPDHLTSVMKNTPTWMSNAII